MRKAAAINEDWQPLLDQFTAFEQAIRTHPIFAAPQFKVQQAFFKACDNVL